MRLGERTTLNRGRALQRVATKLVCDLGEREARAASLTSSAEQNHS